MAAHNSNSRTVGPQLPPALQLHTLSFLPPNDRALSGRLVSPDAAAGLSKDPTSTASLSQPLPPHAVPLTVETGQQHVRQLPFRHKLQLLCTAAASGSEVNLEVALALLQPSTLPDVLHEMGIYDAYSNPGIAAVKAGRLQLLGWLVHHCPGLLADRRDILRAAAQHCDLAGLQAVWGALDGGNNIAPYLPIFQDLLGWVAASPRGAEAKMEWVLAEGRGSCSLQESTATAAARSGDLGRLRWLRERGCPVDMDWVLVCALEKADLAMAQWLVDEAGCTLPAAAGHAAPWVLLLRAAAKSSDCVPKLQWLRERGAPLLGGEGGSDLAVHLLRSAAEAGRVEVVRHLLSITVPAVRQQLLADSDLLHGAAASRSIPLMELLRQAGCKPRRMAIKVYGETAYNGRSLAKGGSVAMFRWLVQEARVSPDGFDLVELLHGLPAESPAHSRDLLEAVQLLVGHARCRAWDDEVALITAARRGELALVQYLLQQTPGGQPGWEVLVAAAEGGCEALLEWLVERHPGCAVRAGASASPYVSAAARGVLGTLTALRRLGVPWGARNLVAKAVWRGAGVPALSWLMEQGAPVGSEQEMVAAARDEDCSVPVLMWLGEQGWPVHCCSSDEEASEDDGEDAEPGRW